RHGGGHQSQGGGVELLAAHHGAGATQQTLAGEGDLGIAEREAVLAHAHGSGQHADHRMHTTTESSSDSARNISPPHSAEMGRPASAKRRTALRMAALSASTLAWSSG